MEKVDAVIVGAGPAGALYAAKLARAGKSVVVLDAGPPWDTQDLVSSQMWARRLRWGGAAPELSGKHPYRFAFNAGWGFGGAATHHYGTWPRFHEEDFRMHSLYGRGFDWPFDYDELRPFYDRIQDEIGLAGDAAAEVWRPPGDPYPMPPGTVFRHGRVIARGFAALGMATAPVPLAVNTVWRHGREPCIYDGWCDAGCPTGALANPLVTYLKDATEAFAELRAHSMVTRVPLASSARVRGVEYVDQQGARHIQPADIVVLAASPVFNPAILLNSASDRHPDGLANSSGAVGRYFMAHTLRATSGLFAADMENHMGLTGAQLISHHGYGKDSRGGAFGSYQWLIAPAVKPNDLAGIAISRADLFGAELDDFMRRAVKHYGVMVGMGEELPEPENRVELGATADQNGWRPPRISHEFNADALALAEHIKEEGLKIFEAAGAEQAWSGPLAQAHMMGGTIMGPDPATSVADSFGRAHDLENLFIAGAGLFPTGAGTNPTFTIHAVTLRAVEHLLGHWGDYAG